MIREQEKEKRTTTIPYNFKEVVASTGKAQWLAAMQSDVNTLQTNHIFNLVVLSPPASCRELAFPVLQLKNLCLLLAYTVMNRHVIHSSMMDVNNAFLQADLHEEIYVTARGIC